MFNGEIYNYIELAESSETAYSDSIVLFNLLCVEGLTSLNKMNGMWAFCYLELEASKVWIARDRYGKKPLFYYWDRHQFIAASEIKSIFAILNKSRRTLNPAYLAGFLAGKLTPFLGDGHSFYSDIRSVDPGGVLCFDLRTQELYQTDSVCFPKPDKTPRQSPSEAAAEALKRDLRQAVSLRLRSDASVAVHVSGGVDSSWIAASAHEEASRACGLGFYTCRIVDEHGNPNQDLHYSRQLCRTLGVKLNEVYVDPFDAKEFIKITMSISEQAELPVNFSLSSISLHLLSRNMHANGIKVALDGIGGDEILGGYPIYRILARSNSSAGNVVKTMAYLRQWIQFARPSFKEMLAESLHASLLFLGRRKISTPLDTMVEELSRWSRLKDLRDDLEWYRSDFFARKRSQSLEETQDFEIHSYQLPYYLYLADQMSMMASIENRSPFLDVNLKKYVSYPDNFKVQNGWNKYVLRRSLPRIIPDEIRWRRGKSGIRSPFTQNVLRDQSVFDIIRASSLINELFNIEGMVRTFDGSCSSGRVDLINMLGVLYPLATLDRSYPLAI